MKCKGSLLLNLCWGVSLFLVEAPSEQFLDPNYYSDGGGCGVYGPKKLYGLESTSSALLVLIKTLNLNIWLFHEHWGDAWRFTEKFGTLTDGVLCGPIGIFSVKVLESPILMLPVEKAKCNSRKHWTSLLIMMGCSNKMLPLVLLMLLNFVHGMVGTVADVCILGSGRQKVITIKLINALWTSAKLGTSQV